MNDIVEKNLSDKRDDSNCDNLSRHFTVGADVGQTPPARTSMVLEHGLVSSIH